jgi:phospholipid/cholesterol/gamma-HCH transport system substrate-binding protein
MNEKLLAFRVGVVVLAAACLAVVLIGIFGGGKGVFQRRYTVYLSFPSAPNVTVDTPVRKNGVLIGRVSNVDLKDDHVVLTARIDANRKLRENEICRISTASLLGDAVLEFVPTSERTSTAEFVQDGDFLADGVVATDPLQVLTNMEDNMQTALVAIKVAADEVAVFTRGLNQTLGNNDQQLQRIVDKSELALDTFQKTMTTIDDVVGDPEIKQGLKQSLSDLPNIFKDVQQTLAEARDAMKTFDRVGQKAEQNLDSLAEFTGPLGEKGEQLMNDLSRSAQNLDELSSQLLVFSQSINSSDGTLGKFINDRELYDDVRETVSNLQAASRRIEPILKDVRVFTDKIATDPRVLGAKGALDRKQSGVGRKWPDTGLPLTPRR